MCYCWKDCVKFFVVVVCIVDLYLVCDFCFVVGDGYDVDYGGVVCVC